MIKRTYIRERLARSTLAPISLGRCVASCELIQRLVPRLKKMIALEVQLRP
jgi:hypothetical protein